MKDSKELIYRIDTIEKIINEMKKDPVSCMIQFSCHVEDNDQASVSKIELYTKYLVRNNKLYSINDNDEYYVDDYGRKTRDTHSERVCKYDFTNIDYFFKDIYLGIFSIIAPILKNKQYPHKEIVTDNFKGQKCYWMIYSNEHPEIFEKVKDIFKTIQEKYRDAIDHILNSIAQREIDKYEQEIDKYEQEIDKYEQELISYRKGEPS